MLLVITLLRRVVRNSYAKIYENLKNIVEITLYTEKILKIIFI